MKFFISIILSLALIHNLGFSESPKKFIREGNKNYKDGKFIDAEVQYKKALEADSNSLKANFNLGNSLYKQGRFDESGSIYQNLASQNIDKDVLAKAYHNLGNSLLKAKKYSESIDAYKRSLRLKPDDVDTKYNLEYARKMLIQEQQQKQQNQKNQQNKDKQDQKQNQNNQDKNKDNKDKNKDNQQSQANNQEQKQDKNQKNQQEPKISKEDAQRMLNAIRNDEKKVQKDVRKLLVPQGNRNLQKKW
ncbi:MAG: tetratricopeptide repeat protein [Candidatus Kapabacteria bacterium]|nr:tetratricopeptide repeat protein [Candidatus Kapabacteria bacterium]